MPAGRVAVLISLPPRPTAAIPDPWRVDLAARASPAAELGRAAVEGRQVPDAEPSTHQEFCRFAAKDMEQTVSKGLACSFTGSLRASEFASFAAELLL